MSFKAAGNEKGVALMLTLWVMTLVIVLAMSFAFFTRDEVLAARNFKEETKAYYAALSAYEEVLHYIHTDRDLQVDYADDEGNVYTDKDRTGVSGKMVVDGIEITIKLTDEESKLNLNSINPNLFKRVLEQAGVPEDEINGITDSMLDWKDPDDAHHLMGAESDYYEALTPPYRAKDGNFDTIEELLLVKGIRKEYVYNENARKSLSGLLTVYSNGINVNTAPREVFEILGINPVLADTLISERKLVGGVKVVPGGMTPYGINYTYSNHFRVEITAKPEGGRQAVKISALIERAQESGGLKIRTKYWREGIESGRA